jgi:HSP20 family molecular chaperone IbpA
MDSLIRSSMLFFGGEEDKNFGVLAMKTDIKEDEKNYEMDVELPGFDKKDISLNMKDGYLTVSAKVDRSLNEKEKKGYIHRERFSGVSSPFLLCWRCRREEHQSRL